jgi:hypothetical protein
MMRQRSIDNIDRRVLASRTFYDLNRWWEMPFLICMCSSETNAQHRISARVDLLSAIFGFTLGTYLVYGPSTINPSDVGFTLVVAGTHRPVAVRNGPWCAGVVAFSDMIINWVRQFNALELEGAQCMALASHDA